MTVLHLRRLRCDYCQNVSPVLISEYDWPARWIEVSKDVPNRVVHVDSAASLHFCSQVHFDQWAAERKATRKD